MNDDERIAPREPRTADEAFPATPARHPRRACMAAVALACAAVCVVVVGAGWGLGWFAGGSSAQDAQCEALGEPASSVVARFCAVEAVAVADTLDDALAACGQHETAVSTEDAADGSDILDAAGASSQTGSAGQPSSQGTAARGASGAVQGDEQEPAGDADADVEADAGKPESSANMIAVSVYVDSSRAADYGWAACLGSTTVSIPEGGTVYDALEATGLALGGSRSYVKSIGGLAEFACGSGSGWLYEVDGVIPRRACNRYTLSGGESIRWIYTLDMGNDV